MSIEPIGVESRRGSPDLDQPGRSLRLLLGPASWMSEDTLQLVGILDDGNDPHVRTALGAGRPLRGLLAHATWADHRIDLINLREKSGHTRLRASTATSSPPSDNGS